MTRSGDIGFWLHFVIGYAAFVNRNGKGLSLSTFRAVLEVLTLATALFAIRQRLYLSLVTKHFQHSFGWFRKLVLVAQ